MWFEIKNTLVSQILVERGINRQDFFGYLIHILELAGVDENWFDASPILKVAWLDVVQPLTYQLVTLLLLWYLF